MNFSSEIQNHLTNMAVQYFENFYKFAYTYEIQIGGSWVAVYKFMVIIR